MEAKFRVLAQQIRASFKRDKRTNYLLYDETIAAKFINPNCLLPAGCIVLRNALNSEEQIELAKACLNEYSHSPFNNVILNHPTETFTKQEHLRKLRWSCLGYDYDWQNRCYVESSKCEFPSYLRDLSVELTTRAGIPENSHTPDGAIINYYRANSNMGPHRDDVEPALNKPLISISLGCDAIFLVETNPYEEDSEVSAIHLKSGDVVILSGRAREALHAVAVIFFETFSIASAKEDEEDLEVMETLRKTRLNLNIKQVEDMNKFMYSFDGARVNKAKASPEMMMMMQQE